MIPVRYNIRYLTNRWTSTAMTAMTFALVVATFIIVRSLAEGMEHALAMLSALVNEDICDYVNALLQHMELRSPFADKTLEDIDAIVEEVLASGSTKANPRDVTREDAALLLNQLFAPAKV